MLKKVCILLSFCWLCACNQIEEESKSKTVCPCDYPEWAQTYLRAVNSEGQCFLLLFSERPLGVYYAVVNVYDSSQRSGVSFYEKNGNPILNGDALYEALFEAYARSGGFSVCGHQFSEAYFRTMQ